MSIDVNELVEIRKNGEVMIKQYRRESVSLMSDGRTRLTLALEPEDGRKLRVLAAEQGTTIGIAARGIIVSALEDINEEVIEAVDQARDIDISRRRRVAKKHQPHLHTERVQRAQKRGEKT